MNILIHKTNLLQIFTFVIHRVLSSYFNSTKDWWSCEAITNSFCSYIYTHMNVFSAIAVLHSTILVNEAMEIITNLDFGILENGAFYQIVHKGSQYIVLESPNLRIEIRKSKMDFFVTIMYFIKSKCIYNLQKIRAYLSSCESSSSGSVIMSIGH